MLAAIPANERDKVFVLPSTAKVYLSKNRTALTEAIQAHLKSCGVETTGAREVGQMPVVKFGFHSLRHSFVSLCRESGAPMAVVQSIVGHSSPAMTLTYQHTSELAAKNAIALLPSISGDVDTMKPAKRALDEVLRDVQGIVEGMSVKNWRVRKSTAMKLLAASV
jgi:integrase